MSIYSNQILELVEATRVSLSNIKPSAWNEQNRFMTTDVSPFPGKFSYDRTPYLREIVDCMAADHPAQIVSVMKGAQIGFSTGVIEAAIGWIISQNPGNILFLTGHSDLAEEAMNNKIDQMIDSCGLRELIQPNVQRKKNLRTGDTNKSKEFPGGSLVAGGAGNHKLLRQRSVRFIFVDDFDAAKSSTKESGSTRLMIEQRAAAYADKMKLFYISTPELKQTSNIEPVYLLGDQRKYHIPCPCCGEFIHLEWSIEGRDKQKAGIYWQLDDNKKLIPESVGYICQKCGDFFTDKEKYTLNLSGQWIPTAEPSQVGYYSYHLSSLYAPPGMYDWEHYVRQYLEAYPEEQPVKISLAKTFTNLCLGLTYEETGTEIKATQLMRNIRPYSAGTVPEALSIRDGNGQIVMLTCAIDMGGICNVEGRDDDVRLDYEIVAWAASGSTYSIKHGSIGTFIFRETPAQKLIPREKWTYNHRKENNVWKELDKILAASYPVDQTGRKMKILFSVLDTGYWTDMAFEYIDKKHFFIVGIKGNPEYKLKSMVKETKNFKPSASRSNLYILDGHNIKEHISTLMTMRWKEGSGELQPAGFMNFPEDAQLYNYENYFSHYEAETKQEEKDSDGNVIGFVWKKKNATVQNHFFDCRYYNTAAKEILVDLYFKSLKIKDYTWSDFVTLNLAKK